MLKRPAADERGCCEEARARSLELDHHSPRVDRRHRGDANRVYDLRGLRGPAAVLLPAVLDVIGVHWPRVGRRSGVSFGVGADLRSHLELVRRGFVRLHQVRHCFVGRLLISERLVSPKAVINQAAVVVGSARGEVRVQSDDVSCLVPLPDAASLGLLGRILRGKNQPGAVFRSLAPAAVAATGGQNCRTEAQRAGRCQRAPTSKTPVEHFGPVVV